MFGLCWCPFLEYVGYVPRFLFPKKKKNYYLGKSTQICFFSKQKVIECNLFIEFSSVGLILIKKHKIKQEYSHIALINFSRRLKWSYGDLQDVKNKAYGQCRGIFYFLFPGPCITSLSVIFVGVRYQLSINLPFAMCPMLKELLLPRAGGNSCSQIKLGF